MISYLTTFLLCCLCGFGGIVVGAVIGAAGVLHQQAKAAKAEQEGKS